MNPDTAIRSRGAIAIGLLCAAGTAYTMFEEVVRHGGAITTDHVMAAVILVVTIGAGHFIWPAVCKLQVFPVLGFLVLKAAGTFICVAGSAGRGDEAMKTRAAEARRNNDSRKTVEDELAKARTDRAGLAAKFASECASGKGARCEGNKMTIEYADSHIRILEVRHEAVKPEQMVNTKIRKAAEVLAFLGYERERAEAGLELMWPFALALLGELGTIVFLSYGMAREKREVKPVKPTKPTKPASVDAWVSEFRRVQGRNPRIDEMRAEFPGIAKATAWRKATGTNMKPKQPRGSNVLPLVKPQARA